MMNRIIARSFAVSAFATVVSATAATITFDAVPSVGNPILTTLDTEGFSFTSDHFHTIDNPLSLNPIVSNGTPVFINEEAGSLGAPITMTQIGGGSFTLTAFDGAEVFVLPVNGFPNADIINVLGNLTGGGTVNASFQLDGFRDGPGGIADFQPFVLPATFTGLDSVVFSGALFTGAPGGFSLDNIVVNGSVPEGGATLALLGMALSVFGFKKRALR